MISTPFDLQSHTARAALTFLTAGLYALAYVPLSDRFGAGVSVLIAIPVIVAAWSFGLRAGLVAGLLALPLNALLLKAGEPGGNVFVRSGGTITLAVVALISAVIGWWGDLREQRRRQARPHQRRQPRRSRFF